MTFVMRVVSPSDYSIWVKAEKQAILSASCPVSSGAISLTAKNISWNTNCLAVPAGAPVSLTINNQDAGIDHDVDIRDAVGKAVIQDQPHTPGGQTSIYQYNALQPGTYTFICSVHPIGPMTGVLTVK